MIAAPLAAWRWEGIGGFLILGGFAFFAAVNHGVKLNVVFGPMVAVGLLYLVYDYRKEKPGTPPQFLPDIEFPLDDRQLLYDCYVSE